MMRIWLAHDELYVSLLLGMWEDAEDCDVDERNAWGELLADTIRHIANGMEQSHGWDKKETIAQLLGLYSNIRTCLEVQLPGDMLSNAHNKPL